MRKIFVRNLMYKTEKEHDSSIHCMCVVANSTTNAFQWMLLWCCNGAYKYSQKLYYKIMHHEMNYLFFLNKAFILLQEIMQFYQTIYLGYTNFDLGRMVLRA